MYNNYETATVPAECVATVGGVASFILLVALPIAILITWLTIVLYRRRVLRAMQSMSPDGIVSARQEIPQTTNPPSKELHFDVVETTAPSPTAQRARQGSRRAGFAYAIAGLIHASIATILTFVFADIELLPLRVLVVWLLYAWPVIPALMLTSVSNPRWKWLMLIGYFGTVLMIDWGLSALGWREGGSGELLTTWLIWMGPPTFLIAVLNNRAWRSVGLLAYLVAIAIVGAYLLSTMGLACLVLTLNDVSLWIQYRHITLIVFFTLLLLGVWWILRIIARRYRDKILSSTSLTIDSWWLVVTLADIVIQYDATNGASVSFILAFFAYKWISKRLRQLPAQSDDSTDSLLLLRVFGHRRRSRKLLDQLSQRWNFIGPISLIGAPDLAATNIEPDDLLQFWGLRLRSLFVAGEKDLKQRMEIFDAQPDADGRYRINEFFCYDNTWRETVHALAQRSDSVLMDLRGFGEENQGCQFELGLLLAEVPLHKVVLLLDASTDREVLMKLLNELWQALPDDSVNRKLTVPTLQLFHASGSLHSVRELMSLLTASTMPEKV